MLIGLGFLFLAGVLAGVLLLGSAGEETLALLVRVVDGFVEKRRSQGFAQIFASASFSSLFFVGALFICGFCAIFQPVEIAMPLFKGLGFGFSVASLYGSYGAQAAAYVGVFMFPGMLLSTIAILFCVKEALKLSASFFSGMRGKEHEPYPLRLYIARFFVAAVVCVLAAFLEAALYSVFANFIILG
jgi:hypothetical protein